MNPLEPPSPVVESREARADDTVSLEPLPAIPKQRFWTRVGQYFLGEDPTLLTALVPTCLLSMLLYTRSPATNFIFDEQEALLANPYVRAVADPSAKIPWIAAFTRDFWGLTPDRTIGSYRPLPDVLWRFLWWIGLREQSAFPHDYVNVMLHGLNGALVTLLVFAWTRERLTAWLSGGLFVATAVVTEAVSGVVGLADVLGGTGSLLALLSLRLGWLAMPFAVIAATMLGLYSKESALCVVPLVPLAALFIAPRGGGWRRWTRAGVAAVATGATFVFYVEVRRRCFPVTTPHELTAAANEGKPLAHRAFAAALRWYAQPALPRDPLNNPLVDASPAYRVAGALRVYTRGLLQLVWPYPLSGDYSAPQEPVPDRLVFPESVVGAAAMVLPLVVAPCLAVASCWRARWRGGARGVGGVLAFAMVWIVVSYFPVSNIPVVLPTIRAERFWYFPAVGSAIILGIASARALSAAKARSAPAWRAVVGLLLAFFVAQTIAARRHALDYTNDLVFWNATRRAVPRSAKAHLNYSVMLGARGDLEGRLASNDVALRLAPKWPMANVYEGDTLCRMHRAPEAVPHYLDGFALGPNDMSLIALALQCLWDEGLLGDDSPTRDRLKELADRYPGSWLKYLVDDIVANGTEYKGVNPKYRPRGYNEGPKGEE